MIDNHDGYYLGDIIGNNTDDFIEKLMFVFEDRYSNKVLFIKPKKIGGIGWEVKIKRTDDKYELDYIEFTLSPYSDNRISLTLYVYSMTDYPENIYLKHIYLL